MPKMELTDRFCAAAKTAPGRRQTEFFDTAVKGLSLLASNTGGRTFYLHFTRPADGRRARMRLGSYPEIRLAKARERARAARGEVGEGTDPLAEKRSQRASLTVSDLIENYVARHASTKRTGTSIARRLRKNVADQIGCVRLAHLHRRDITRCLDAVIDRGAHIEANRVFEDARSMIRWARARGDLDQNIMDGMRLPTVMRPRDRVLTADEIAALWSNLEWAADIWNGTKRIVRLLLLTGQRVSEVTGMTRDEIDLDGGLIWTLPGARTKNGQLHAVPLSGLAIDIIREQLAAVEALDARKRRPPAPWVFPGQGGHAPITGNAISRAVRRHNEALGVAAFRPHDLRRTAATHMEELGVSPHVVGHVLNHVSVTRSSITSRVYARYDYAAEKRRALGLWADRLAGIVFGGAGMVQISRGAS